MGPEEQQAAAWGEAASPWHVTVLWKSKNKDGEPHLSPQALSFLSFTHMSVYIKGERILGAIGKGKANVFVTVHL